MVDAFIKIPKQEGFRTLFLGLAPTTIGYSLQGALKFGIFEWVRDRIVDFVGYEKATEHKLAIYCFASTLGEIAATVALCPWEAIRIRAVAASHGNLLSPNTNNQSTSLYNTFLRVVQTEGFMNGFYRGIGPILFKQVPYTVTQITAFSLLVEKTYKDVLPSVFGLRKEQLTTQQQLGISVLCGTLAGAASAVVSHPPDTLLSKINAYENLEKESATTRMRKILKETGFRGIWAGIGTRIFMVGTLSASMFLIYDSVKVLVGLPTTGGISTKKMVSANTSS
jgi:solute carrier family 25 phosphate transporter 3